MTDFNLMKTVNGGLHWDTVLTDSSLLWWSDPVYISHQEIIMAQTTYFIGDTIKVYKSIDGGDSWNIISKFYNANIGNTVDQLTLTDSLTGYLLSFGSLLKTTDGGYTWSFIKSVG